MNEGERKRNKEKEGEKRPRKRVPASDKIAVTTFLDCAIRCSSFLHIIYKIP